MNHRNQLQIAKENSLKEGSGRYVITKNVADKVYGVKVGYVEITVIKLSIPTTIPTTPTTKIARYLPRTRGSYQEVHKQIVN